MPAGQQQQEPDNSLTPLWITLGLFIAGALIWYYFYKEIVEMIFTVRMWEADLIGIFVPSAWAQQLDSAKQLMVTAKQAGYSGVTFGQVMHVSSAVGYYLRFPVLIILSSLALIVYISNPLSKFKKTYSMQSLLKQEKAIWPHIMVVSNLNLLEKDIHKGPWAMAMNPMAFSKYHKLLKYENKQTLIERFEGKGTQTADLIRDEARKIFALQLGRYWSGPEALPIHARALFAIFAARVNSDRDGAAKLQEQISRSAISEKLNFSGVDALLKKHKDNKHIIKICKRHAFELTVMPSMLDFARQDGVLPSSEFLWLKVVDRRLWYTLNCTGRQTPFSEVAGIYSHWISENAFGKPLNVPMVEEAVNGLEAAIKEVIYKPEDDDE